VIALHATDAVAAGELEVLLRESRLRGAAVKHDICAENPALWDHPEIQNAEHLTFVHNACATFAPMPLHQLTWQDFENSHRAAVEGAWRCSQRLIRLMLRKKGGTVITVLSAAIEGAPPKGFGAYVTAKHALHGFTLALAAEYAPRGLKIFSVSPGYMETSQARTWDDRLRQIIRDQAERVTIPAAAAGQIVALAENAGTPGQGENHPVLRRRQSRL
jgi:NAD(P)-dependent dehydrogenase (short-subunit alcohol dehydrogenase family)